MNKKGNKIFIIWITILGIISFIIDYYIQQNLRNYIFNQCPKSLTLIEFEECLLELGYFIVVISSRSNFIFILFILCILSWLFCWIKRKRN